ncbi:MAG TPA: PLP-dependent aminotransferase family protein [Phototrophicaceae bacterium]|nr:PLP-dependent aminotransferase family protein [Phototrophicaceae bacterium]
MHNSPQGTHANTISLMLGHPDPATLLSEEFLDTANRVLSSPALALGALQYGKEQGSAGLIEYLVGKINREQSLSLSAENLMIAAGSTHAVDMIARLYARSGSVIVEAPTYADALHIFRDHDLPLYGVPMDDSGVIVADFAALLERLAETDHPARIFYTIPNFHNPSGRTLAQDRRVEIAKLAQRYGVTVVEDDVYRDLAFEPPLPSSFLALDVNAIQIGSFSKTLAPGLRLGWIAASAQTISAFVNCGTTQMGGGASPLSAQIVAEYCRAGLWEPHVQALRKLYQMRRDLLLNALDRYMPSEVTWTQPAGGFFIWLTLPERLLGREVKARALERGVLVSAGEGYFINPMDGAHHLRLTYSFAPPAEIDKAAQILAEIVSV